jgi:antidote-toxin recognition MazE-like antitoxin
MSVAKQKPKKPQAAAKPAAKPDPKPDAPNGLPLRRKSVWAIDTESPQFRAARKRDALALKSGTDDRDSLQFLDAVLAEKDVQKWWK